MQTPAWALAACALAACASRVSAQHETSTGAGSTIIYIVVAIIAVLFLIVAFFVWKRRQNRHRDGNGVNYSGSGLPSTTRPGARSRDEPPMTGSFDLRVAETPMLDSAPLRKDSHMQQQVRPPQWPVNGAPTYTRQQREQEMRRQAQAQAPGVYAPQQMSPPPPPPPPSEDRQMTYEQQQAAAASRAVNESNSVPAGRQPTAEMLARSREAADRVMADFKTDPDFESRWIPYTSLYFTRVLSKGAFGEVWLAQLENTQVAVKRILQEKKHDEKEIECFGAEIKLMALFQHPKIVGFLGVSWSATQDLCAVTEFMSKGDLYGYLKRRSGKLNWRDHKIFLAEDVADALVYLHSLSPKVIHRDLKSKNILLDDSFRAKLSDFGISRKRSLEDTMTAGVGTIYWTAPEVLMGKKYTEKADIYSFGIVMSEMDTCAVPYSDKRDEAGKKLQGMKIVQLVIRMALRPSFAPDCPSAVKKLADRCLDTNPDVRPDAPELLRLLRRMQDKLA